MFHEVKLAFSKVREDLFFVVFKNSSEIEFLRKTCYSNIAEDSYCFRKFGDKYLTTFNAVKYRLFEPANENRNDAV